MSGASEAPATKVSLERENDELRREIERLKAAALEQIPIGMPRERGGPSELIAQPGDVMGVHGIADRPELNGKLATLQYYDTPSSRWSVLIEGRRYELSGNYLHHTPRGSAGSAKAPANRQARTARAVARAARSARSMSPAQYSPQKAANSPPRGLMSSPARTPPRSKATPSDPTAAAAAAAARGRSPPRTKFMGVRRERVAPLAATERAAFREKIKNPRRHEEVLC